MRVLSMITGGLSMAGVVMRLHHLVKERVWEAPPVLIQADVILINFQWTDLQVRHGFSQVPGFWGIGNEGTFTPMKVVVDQPDRDSWQVKSVFSLDHYNEGKQDEFFTHFQALAFLSKSKPASLLQATLTQMLHDPLQVIWDH